tara:strand:+ start:359 stop:634 length:276 start_codon:yes stop_codon:yes gene_type:complete
MRKNLDKAIGTIQHELVRSIDEFHKGDELIQDEISNAWSLILQELNNSIPLGEWYRDAKRRKVIDDEYKETLVIIKKAEQDLIEKRKKNNG